MVTANENHNKFYRMIPQGNQFTAIWGRVGTNGASCVYPIHQWDAKYSEKINKGYTDQSATYLNLDKPAPSVNADSTEPKKLTIGETLMSALIKASRKFMKRNYRIDAKHITSAMIRKAEDILSRLIVIGGQNGNVCDFNETLCELFMAIPRVMPDTRQYVARSQKDYAYILEREANYLDSLKGIVGLKAKDEASTGDDVKAIMKNAGLTIKKATKAEKASLEKLVRSSGYSIQNVYRIENRKTRKAFNDYVLAKGITNVQELFHGSRTENFASILTEGLRLNPNAVITGKMFGQGIYFAPSARKSIGYTSVSGSYWASGHDAKGYLAVYDVAVGKTLDVSTYGNYGTYTERDMKRHGTDSLYAHKGTMLRNDEVIVYNEAAATIRFLIEIE